MTLPSTEQIENLSRAELLELTRQLLTLTAQLHSRIAELEAELEKRNPPPANSRNSSLPPSRDMKKNQQSDQSRKKHGPPFGHQRNERQMVDNPDQVITAELTACRNCQCDLHHLKPDRIVRHQVTELPEIKPVVIETRFPEVRCPNCEALNRGSLPAALEEIGGFGPRLKAAVVYFKQEQHLSYERIVEMMGEIFSISLSQGAVAAIIEAAGKQAAPVAEEIRDQVIRSEVIGSDETSARVGGRNWWQWVFIGGGAVYHQIVARRNSDVISEVMGESEAQVWVCDCFGAQAEGSCAILSTVPGASTARLAASDRCGCEISMGRRSAGTVA